MCRRKSMRSRPYALTEWLDRSASQIQGTRAPAVLGASPPVASRARARKASTLAAGRGVALQEVGPLGHQGSVGRGGRLGRKEYVFVSTHIGVICIAIWPVFCNG